jgi:hypothetical protein
MARARFVEDFEIMIGGPGHLCDRPDTCGVRLEQDCHPRAGLIAKYFRARHEVVLICARCRGVICAVAVATGGALQ